MLPPPRLDYRSISENFVSKSTNAINRKAPITVEAIQSVSRLYNELKHHSNTLNAKRNSRSVIGEAIRKSALQKDQKAKNAAMEDAKKLKEEISELETLVSQTEQTLLETALAIPNDTHPSSPLGPESAAVILASHGPDPIPVTPTRDHVAIGKKLGWVDLENASSTTGSSWYYLTNEGALLEMALTNYALSVAIKHGFKPVTTPDVVRSDIARRCGFQPRDPSNAHVSQVYHLQNTSPAHSPELVLSATSEIPLAGLFANQLFLSSSLPMKVVGVGHAFRAEAGASGADTRGLYRVHQFTKVELFSVTTEDKSEGMMEEMRRVQTAILDGLRLPFRILDMPTEELGASAYRKYDMEVWMPGRGRWGEVSSLSNCTDFQARRLLIRYHPQTPKSSEGPTPTSTANKFAHTLNGTAAAVPRLIVALIENGIVLDESGEPVALELPSVLRPFWLGDDNLIRWQS
ncbi:seryl-tRNA synthetase [Dendrothele bispora CBS 962.96]|uniref:serine--tRNA ligase n=1 Tax=Dendrothele bispora (strain CBS 962.96) TaxID=1314807 RepID=A0A4S8MWA4_DENBC|nr:seryl-tRNA synthetase [Dendrothele bispora CBS 962.96]